jgi:hypothetical protein
MNDKTNMIGAGDDTLFKASTCESVSSWFE